MTSNESSIQPSDAATKARRALRSAACHQARTPPSAVVTTFAVALALAVRLMVWAAYQKANGRRQTADGRRQTANGRRQTAMAEGSRRSSNASALRSSSESRQYE